MIKDTRTALFK